MKDAGSLYARIGGEAAVVAAVNLFYDRVLQDERTRPFFAALDMLAQRKKQLAFMTWAFGGPAEYKGRELRVAHEKLVKTQGLNDGHFDAVAGHPRGHAPRAGGRPGVDHRGPDHRRLGPKGRARQVSAGPDGLPFDRIELGDDAARRVLTVSEFLALTLPVRIDAVVRGHISFFSGATPVDKRLALKSLMALSMKQAGLA